MTLYKNKYRSESARLPGWDYGSDGSYFVTICTKNRIFWFGGVVDGTVVLSDMGLVAQREWEKTETMRQNVRLGEFVVMPNHIHGIVIIDNGDVGIGGDALQCVPTTTSPTTTKPSTAPYKNRFGPQRNNLASIIRGYKSAVTKKIRETISPGFAWQGRFHDHIIRDEESFHRISKYIQNNPINWTNDDFFHS